MRRGSVLILVLGVLFAISTLTVFFLQNISKTLIHINQIDPCNDLETSINSALAITMANLYLRSSENISLENCQAGINKSILGKIGKNISVKLSAEDAKIPICNEYMPLIEQLFFSLGCSYEETASLISDLNDLLSETDRLINFGQLLKLPNFKNVFLKNDGFLSKKWKNFTKNTTLEQIDAINIREASDDVLMSICLLENWCFADAKAAIHSKSHLSISESTDVFLNLTSRGLLASHSLFFRDYSSYFIVKISANAGEIFNVKKFLIKRNNARNWHGFPLEVISQTDKP